MTSEMRSFPSIVHSFACFTKSSSLHQANYIVIVSRVDNAESAATEQGKISEFYRCVYCNFAHDLKLYCIVRVFNRLHIDFECVKHPFGRNLIFSEGVEKHKNLKYILLSFAKCTLLVCMWYLSSR